VSTEDDDFFEDESPKRSIAASIAVLQAQVRLLAWVVKNNLVSKHEFSPVKLIAYGIAGLVISSVLVAILSMVVRGVVTQP